MPQRESDLSASGANVFDRIYTVSPRECDGYFLRLLLSQTLGAVFYEN